MKTIYYIKRLITVFAMLLMAMNAFSQAPPTTTIGPAVLAAGTYTVPVTVANFPATVGQISLIMNYDVTKLTYTGITLNTGLLPANAQTTPASDVSGQIRLSYSSSAAIVLAAPATQLFTVTFTAKAGVQGISTPLTWSVLQGACDYATTTGLAYTPAITPANQATYFINGAVLIPPVPTITGPASTCPATATVYTTEAAKTGYVWTISTGGTITAGAGTNSVTVNWIAGAVAPTISVTYTDPIAGAALAPTVKAVTVSTLTPSLSGPITACAGSTTNVYTTDAGMTGYVWTPSAGGVVTLGAGTNSVTVTWNTAGAQSMTVTYTPPTGCTITPTVLPVTVNALPVPTITGPAAACVGSTGNIYTTEVGMTGYTWTVSAGGTITAGAGTNAITVTWSAAGAQTVSVNYANASGCTAATAVALPVTVNALPVPTFTTAPLSVCIGSTANVYTTQAGMTGYVWTVSAGGTITAGGTATSNTATVTWNTVGPQTVSVNYANASACTATTPVVANVTVNNLPVPTITGPIVGGVPATLAGGVTTGQVYTTEAGMTGYVWTVSGAGTITAGAGTNSITVTWTNPTAQQFVTVNYTSATGCPAAAPTVYLINFYPFAANIDATKIPQFVDPVPHFAAGLRVDMKAGGNLLVKAVPVRQIALSTGTVLATGTIGPANPTVGMGSYQAYAISKDNGVTFGPAMWPAQTIEAKQGFPITVQYRNDLFGLTYANFNILADQTLLMNGYPQNGNILTDPYTGPIPMVVHLHGGEIPSNSDGGPTAWFTPGYAIQGPGFAQQASTLCTYPNLQEGTTLWYHPHDQGLTRINVYCGLAGYYFLRGANEDALHLPGWSGDDKVREITPAGKTATFNGANTYLPEIELAIQDRMFNVNGELYWPVAPTNPDAHPFWTPEFFGDVMTVNGKSWPYLSVAPRKYLFRLLDGCNARFLNLWLMNLANATNGPKITVISTEGGLLDAPVDILPGQKLFLAPAERPMVIIDFTGLAGQTFTLMNDAPAPYPTGTPVTAGLTDRIMQFVVNGQMVSAANPLVAGTDKGTIPANLRPSVAMTRLTNFNGTTTVTPTVKRQIILNEITGAGGPLMVAINNSHFDPQTPFPGAPFSFGGPTEIPTEGTTEMWQIINTTVDAHPIHPHLVQWQLVSRQAFNTNAYMAAYSAAWAPRLLPNFPAGATYPGGAGSPLPYNTLNADNAVGGNPAITPFLTGPVIPALPEEMGWKDSFKALPGQVSTYIVRYAPTDLPITATAAQLVFPFDPSLGPGYVWHCHIIDHEDMDMMRPYPVSPSPQRFPKITTQPVALVACAGDVASFNVVATSANPVTYQWQVSINSGVAWTNVVDGAPGPYTNSTTATLSINPAVIGLNTYQYRCILTNLDGVTTSNAALLTVNNCTISGTLKYNNAALDPLVGMTVNANGKSAVTTAGGAYTITGVTSGVQNVTVTPSSQFVGSINSTDAGAANFWFSAPTSILHVKFLAGDVNADNAINAADALAIQLNFVFNQAFTRGTWSFWEATGQVTSNSDPNRLLPISVTVNGNSAVLPILAMATGDFNGSLNPLAAKSAEAKLQLTYGETRKIGANQEIELPLRVASSMEVGAVSLILNIPTDLVEVKDVYMKGSNDKPSFNVKGNELRIGWNSLTPINLQAAGELVVLKLKTTSAFTDGSTVKIKLETNPLNELANGRFNVISDAVLNTDALIGINDKPGSYALSSYPNPFSENTTLSYTLPKDANVTLQIYNLLGVVVKNLVNEHQSAGIYTVPLDASKMPQGTYTATLRINDNNKIVEKTIKLVVNK